MSAEATAWTFRHSPVTGATLVVHLAIADSVNDQHGNEFWMAIPRLASKARVERRTAGRAVAELVDWGMIECLSTEPDAMRSGRPLRYRFLFPDEADIVYESRTKDAGATTQPTHRVRRENPPGGSTDRTGCDSGSQGVGPVVAQTQENPTKSKRNPTRAPHPDVLRLADLLADQVATYATARPKVTKAWLSTLDRMIRLDERTPQQIEHAIMWATQDDFWYRNVMSPTALRKNYERLRLDAKDTTRKRRSTNVETMDTLLHIVADLEAQEAHHEAI